MVRILVGNVGAHCTEPLMRSVFEAYGQVDDVTVSSNCAIIQMPNTFEAEEAIQGLSDTACFLTPVVATGARELMWARFHSA